MAVLAGCAAGTHEEDASASTQALTWVDGRNTLTVEADVGPVRCEGLDPMLAVSGTIESTNAVRVVMIIDGTDLAPIDIVFPGDFMPNGATQIASFATDQVVPSGAHTIELCFAVVTSRGVSTIRGCLPAFDYDISCDMPVDTTPPTITASRSPEANAAGWNNTDVTVSFSCEDADSGIASCSAPVVLSGEGVGQGATGMAVDNAGNSAEASLFGINIDKTAPSVSLSGTRAYFVDETVSVTCDAYDDLSGVESSTCNGAAGDAYSFGVGEHAVSASASDYAGNSASAEGSFSVVVSGESLCRLIERLVPQRGVANSLCMKLRVAGAAQSRGLTWTAKHVMRAYDFELTALRGRHVPTEHYATLRDLGQALIAH